MKIDFLIENQTMRRIDSTLIAANSQNYIEAGFSFDKSWNGFFKKAVFTKEKNSYCVPIEDGKCCVPYEVTDEGEFSVSAIGINSESPNIRATTNNVTIKVVKGPSLNSSNASEPVASELEKLEAIIENSKNQVDALTAKANSGAFNGKSATVSVGNISVGNNASVTNSGTQTEAVLDFVLPKGEAGVSVESVNLEPGNRLVCSLSDGTDIDAGDINPPVVWDMLVNSQTTQSASAIAYSIPSGIKYDEIFALLFVPPLGENPSGHIEIIVNGRSIGKVAYAFTKPYTTLIRIDSAMRNIWSSDFHFQYYSTPPADADTAFNSNVSASVSQTHITTWCKNLYAEKATNTISIASNLNLPVGTTVKIMARRSN